MAANFITTQLILLLSGCFGLVSLDPIPNRIDCYPEPNASPEACRARSCLFEPASLDTTPWCFYRPDFGYKIDDKTANLPTAFQLHKHTPSSGQGVDIMRLNASILFYGDSTVRFTFRDAVANRYEVPIELWPAGQPDVKPESEMLEIKIVEKGALKTFSFQIQRKSTGTVLWDMMEGFVYADQFLQIATKLPSDRMYGFGENAHQTLKHDFSKYKLWPIFATDQEPRSGNDGSELYYNLYGTHPFYLLVEPDGNAHGVTFINSNAQEYQTLPGPALLYRSIGGIIDVYLFGGPTPHDVINQFWQLIGAPAMPPYWALGFQLSRWGYKNLDSIQRAIDRTKYYEIPQDVQVFDIDYMDRFKDFTVDQTQFKELSTFVEKLHQDGMKAIVILDPAIDVGNDDYPSFHRGLEKEVFLKWPPGTNFSFVERINSEYNGTCNTDLILGTVWPDSNVAFPDFFKTSTSQWWAKEIELFYKAVKFDAIWIDMNEPANWATNEKNPWYFNNPPIHDKPQVPNLICPRNRWNNPAYETYTVYYRRDVLKESPEYILPSKTLCMDVSQGDRNQFRHYDVHSLYGFKETTATFNALKQLLPDQRPLVLSRSTFLSSGRYAIHWLGDNSANFNDLRMSVIGIQEFNMFGLPFVGPDVCGFNGNSWPELCLRWMQIAAFYPFSRNHNAINMINQDPGAFGDDVGFASKKSITLRYTLLPYYYTLFYQAHKFNQVVVRPLFFEFTNDTQTYDINEQYMFGHALLITPVLRDGVTDVRGYFPPGLWFSIRPDDFGSTISDSAAGGFYDLQAPINWMIPVHIRGGAIVPRQQAALNTELSRRNKIQLLVAANTSSMATGQLYWDDGKNADADLGVYYSFTFKAVNNNNILQVTGHKIKNNGKVTTPKLGILELLSVEIQEIDTNSLEVNQEKQTNIKQERVGRNCLRLIGFNIDMSEGETTITWKNAKIV